MHTLRPRSPSQTTPTSSRAPSASRRPRRRPPSRRASALSGSERGGLGFRVILDPVRLGAGALLQDETAAAPAALLLCCESPCDGKGMSKAACHAAEAWHKRRVTKRYQGACLWWAGSTNSVRWQLSRRECARKCIMFGRSGHWARSEAWLRQCMSALGVRCCIVSTCRITCALLRLADPAELQVRGKQPLYVHLALVDVLVEHEVPLQSWSGATSWSGMSFASGAV